MRLALINQPQNPVEVVQPHFRHKQLHRLLVFRFRYGQEEFLEEVGGGRGQHEPVGEDGAVLADDLDVRHAAIVAEARYKVVKKTVLSFAGFGRRSILKLMTRFDG